MNRTLENLFGVRISLLGQKFPVPRFENRVLIFNFSYIPTTALLPPSVRSHFTSNLIGYNYIPFLILMLSSGIKIQWQPFIVINFKSNKIDPRSLLFLYDWLNIPDFWCFGVWIHSIYIHLLHFTTIRINWNYKTRRVA